MEFTRDVEMVIISKLDIDTRRNLGIYSKLKIPESLRMNLERVIQPIAVDSHQYCVDTYRVLLPNIPISLGQNYKYVLERDVWMHNDGITDYKVLVNVKVVESYVPYWSHKDEFLLTSYDEMGYIDMGHGLPPYQPGENWYDMQHSDSESDYESDSDDE
jgi:hypothetical protein